LTASGSACCGICGPYLPRATIAPVSHHSAYSEAIAMVPRGAANAFMGYYGSYVGSTPLPSELRRRQAVSKTDEHAAVRALVTVASYTQALEARVALTRLEDAGIPAFLTDENLVTMNWTWSNAVGGVKLQVSDEHATRAVELLDAEVPAEEPDTDAPTDDTADACPDCGSPDIEQHWRHRRLVYASWMVLGVPIPLLRRGRRCRGCGSRWKGR